MAVAVRVVVDKAGGVRDGVGQQGTGRFDDRLDRRTDQSGSAGLDLRAAIDESWDALRPWEQAAWAQCSVFEGGFTLEAAEEVIDLELWEHAPWVMDVVQSLVDKSLLRTWVPEPGVGRAAVPEARFGMYVSLQEYARERLREEDAIAGGPAVGRIRHVDRAQLLTDDLALDRPDQAAIDGVQDDRA